MATTTLKQNVERVIQCRSKADQQSALFATQVCAVMQDEYNKKALFPEQYKEQQQQYAREQIPVLPYIQEVIKKIVTYCITAHYSLLIINYSLCYFPMQNREKTTPSISSVVTSPVISPK